MIHTAPRMTVAWCGDPALGRRLVDAGHRRASDAMHLGRADIVIIDVPEDHVTTHVDHVAAQLHPGTIVVVHSFFHSTAVVAPLRKAGAVAMVVSAVSGDRWLVTADDEVAGTVAQLLLAEVGATTVDVGGDERDRYITGVVLDVLAEAVTEVAAQLRGSPTTGTEIPQKLWYLPTLRRCAMIAETYGMKHVLVAALAHVLPRRGSDEIWEWIRKEHVSGF